MKLLLVIVSIIAVFTADCRDLTGEPENHGSANNTQNFRNEPLDRDSTEEDPQLKDVAVAVADIYVSTDFDSTTVEYLGNPSVKKHLMEEKIHTKVELRRSGCKARNACVVMGGFCVTNATLCSGRLVAEGCKGANCQCCVPGTLELKIQSLEMELQSMKHNLTNTNEELKIEIQSLKSNNSDASSDLKIELHSMEVNITKGDANMELKLDSVKDAITNQDSDINALKASNSNQYSKLNSINSAISNQDSKLVSINSSISNQDAKFNSLNIAISNQNSDINTLKVSNSNQETKLTSLNTAISNQDLKLNTLNTALSNQNSNINNLKSSNSNQESKLNSLITAISNQDSKLNALQGCSNGFLVSSQCFRLYMDVKRNWNSARSKCQSAGLRLAEPEDSVAAALRKYLLDHFGSDVQAWLGAKGDGSKFVWEKRGTYLYKEDALWDNGPLSSSYMSTSYCLELDALLSEYNQSAGRYKPYDWASCTASVWTLCEDVKGLVY